MNPIIEKLHTLQRLQGDQTNSTAKQQEEIKRLRGDVPAPFLAHFDRLLKVGRKGVAEVRHGTCTGCHLRLPASLTHAHGAKDDEDVQLCENCGAYLYFVPDEPVAETPAPVAPPTPRRRGRKLAAATA